MSISIRHEEAGIRPALIVSVNLFNHGPADLVVVLPITTKNKKIPLHVRVMPSESGLTEISFIKCEDVRSVSTERLLKRLGSIDAATLVVVEDKLRILSNGFIKAAICRIAVKAQRYRVPNCWGGLNKI